MTRNETMKQLLTSVDAILFDVDGTLVDSNDLHAEAWAKALNKDGEAFSAKTLRPWIGKGGDKILSELVGIDDKGPRGQKIAETRSRLFKEDFAPRIKAFPKARELLLNLRERKFQVILATSAQSDELASILKASQLENAVTLITSSDDAEESKPDPDIINAALKKLDVRPDNAIMVGDTPYDVEAALAAGVRVIAVRSGGWDDQALKGALCIFDDVGEFYSCLQSIDLH